MIKNGRKFDCLEQYSAWPEPWNDKKLRTQQPSIKESFQQNNGTTERSGALILLFSGYCLNETGRATPAIQKKPDLFENMLPLRECLYDEFEPGENRETGRCATKKTSES